jgi:carboxyl-terminal processing protease
VPLRTESSSKLPVGPCPRTERQAAQWFTTFLCRLHILNAAPPHASNSAVAEFPQPWAWYGLVSAYPGESRMLVRSLLAAGRLLAVCLVLATNVARAQVVTLAEPVVTHDDLAVVLEQGSRLERERRWAEALSHYEDALRLHPQRPDLQQRVSVARAHYEVCRRHNDPSYAAALTKLTDRDALSIYDEVLLKVQSHYVHEPQWQRLLQSGQTSMQVAVTEPLFVSRYLATAPVDRLAGLQREVEQLVASRNVTDRRQASELVQSVGTTLRERYGIPSQAVILEFVSGAAAALDEYSSFLTGSQMDELFSQIEGNFVGLGVELKTEKTGLTIVNVISGGPAHVGGIRAGDMIVAVDGKTPNDTSPDTMADMLRGVEGTQVAVLVRNAQGTLQNLKLTRRRVEIPSVEQVKIIDPTYGVGYFKLTSFQKTTSRDVDAALWKLHEQGMRQLIIDLRGNPGGLLKAAVEVADRFVYEGLIVATRGRSPREDFDHKGEVAGTWRVPLVLLIDHDSASASEILAGAIRDHRRGTVVGEKSYGKGSVQGIFPLATANVGIRLTTAKWYTPSGQAISGTGIKPDVVVQIAKPAANGGSLVQDTAVTALKPVSSSKAAAAPLTDSILEAGLQVARSQTSSRRSVPQTVTGGQ